MRAISSAMRQRLSSGATTLCHVWRITRVDGSVLGLTDHDHDVTLQGLACRPAPGLTMGAIDKRAGLGIDTAAIEGVLDSAAITAEDLAAGLWDGAMVEVIRVDWANADDPVLLFAGRLGEVRDTGAGMVAELRGLTAALNQSLGRTFARLCDAEVGDGRCGVSLGAQAYSGAGVVAAVNGASRIEATGIGEFADGWFSQGMITTASGRRLRCLVHTQRSPRVALELAKPHPFAIGDTFTITAGCDRRFETCRAKFSNARNFRGFPHVPGPDLLSAGPPLGQVMDGSKR